MYFIGVKLETDMVKVLRMMRSVYLYKGESFHSKSLVWIYKSQTPKIFAGVNFQQQNLKRLELLLYSNPETVT